LREYWNANIFHPHPLALAYSEHLTPQAAMILPVWALTKNPILCYNLVFLSTFLLSAFGMFLFVRNLTASQGAAFVAGLAFGFAPYRFGTMSHVQVLSSMWMPFALLGAHRFFQSGLRALCCGGNFTTALVDGGGNLDSTCARSGPGDARDRGVSAAVCVASSARLHSALT